MADIGKTNSILTLVFIHYVILVILVKGIFIIDHVHSKWGSKGGNIFTGVCGVLKHPAPSRQ